MPDAQTVLPLCIGLSLVGVVVALFVFRRGRRGRAVQVLALALLPVALYLTGLLRLVWDAVVALARWATGDVFDLAAWIGFGVLALCVVLWIVGGVLGRRRRRVAKAAPAGSAKPGQVTTGRSSVGRTRQPAAAAPAQDDDMAEIEALLKSRGIQ
ncbi:MAG: hypothetical protein ACRYG2_17115 [Janthinobacterium lividum]